MNAWMYVRRSGRKDEEWDLGQGDGSSAPVNNMLVISNHEISDILNLNRQIRLMCERDNIRIA